MLLYNMLFKWEWEVIIPAVAFAACELQLLQVFLTAGLGLLCLPKDYMQGIAF
jgi:hypothetical protein